MGVSLHSFSAYPPNVAVTCSLLSGYSRFPVHEAGNPSAFIGTLLIKKVYSIHNSPFPTCSALTFAALDLRPKQSPPRIFFPAYHPPRSPAHDQLLPSSGLLVSRLETTSQPHPSLTPFPHFSQTGRAHLLLISTASGKSGGGLGVITLEDIIEVRYLPNLT